MDVKAKSAILVDAMSLNTAMDFIQLHKRYENEPDYESLGLNEHEVKTVKMARAATFAVNVQRLVVLEMKQVCGLLHAYRELKERFH